MWARWRDALRLCLRPRPEDVAHAFRRLSARVHPDKCAHPGAGDAQALLSAARDGLLRNARPATPSPHPSDDDSGEMSDFGPL